MLNGVAHNYLYTGGKLMRQTWGSNTLDFFYDESGHPYALTHNGTTYYYVTNLQGDVLAILDGNKQVVASYTYDPYGKVLSATGTLAEVNPLRYRGYVYDSETGFYYLQSRYYDPTTCRFINADSYASTGQGIIGCNMFAYCGNNPISRIDTAGMAWEWWEDFLNDVKTWLESEKEDAQDNRNETRSVGFTGSAAFGAGGSVSAGVTYDTKGNVGIIATTNGGGAFPSVGVGFFSSSNNTPTIYHQRGLGAAVGASVGPGVIAVGGEYNMIIDQSNGDVYHGITASATYGLYPTIVEVHGEVGNTWVWGFNVYEAAIGVIEIILGQ